MELGEFAKSIYFSHKMDGAPEGADWSLALIDCLILREIEKAMAAGKEPKDFVKYMLMMASERAADWGLL